MKKVIGRQAGKLGYVLVVDFNVRVNISKPGLLSAFYIPNIKILLMYLNVVVPTNVVTPTYVVNL